MGLFGIFGKPQNDEEGSFCDTSSQRQYNVHDGFEANKQRQAAEARGEEIVEMDKPMVELDGDRLRVNDNPDEYKPGEKWTVHSVEEDGQGRWSPTKYRPGR